MLFGRRVDRCADDALGFGLAGFTFDLFFFDRDGETEIEYFHSFAGKQHDIFGFDIAVDDHSVCVFETGQNLQRYFDGQANGQEFSFGAFLFQVRAKRNAFE